MLKLYSCTAVSTDHDWTVIIVAESEQEAKDKFSNMVEESGSWYAGEYVNELKLEGYEVIVKKKGND